MRSKNNVRKERSIIDKSQYLDVGCDEYFCKNKHFLLKILQNLLSLSEISWNNLHEFEHSYIDR